ncbi:14105_t:CDS:2 [Acaulospora morrowiae]|uniref:14105_t:CDS:1 n=1 Tax=Acaulospora morrowiae TaxID=94023 RepID=A0A9N8VMY5_9GLOM|nr:14105_t:CDS:2 [Acaulospora morrowiae]
MPSEPSTPTFKVYTSTHPFLSQPIHFQITTFDESAFIWIGAEGNEVLGNLAVAMPPPRISNSNGGVNLPSATTIMTKDIDESSKQLGYRLSSKFNKQFFVSLNLPPNADQMMVSFAEKKVLSMIKDIYS